MLKTVTVLATFLIVLVGAYVWAESSDTYTLPTQRTQTTDK